MKGYRFSSGQDTGLGCWPGPQLGVRERQLIKRQPFDVSLTHRCFSLSHSPSLPFSLKINFKTSFKIKDYRHLGSETSQQDSTRLGESLACQSAVCLYPSCTSGGYLFVRFFYLFVYFFHLYTQGINRGRPSYHKQTAKWARGQRGAVNCFGVELERRGWESDDLWGLG